MKEPGLRDIISIAVRYATGYISLVSHDVEIGDRVRMTPIITELEDGTFSFVISGLTSNHPQSLWVDGFCLATRPTGGPTVLHKLDKERVMYPGDTIIINFIITATDISLEKGVIFKQ